ncbi:MAG: hypothetical protein JSV16_07275 [Candidatus Hydrogenedentota bacterium]|nr:MAG: hypothetical protein JSV16_07275 [Candidatus Hydrogenedentota bacterium]
MTQARRNLGDILIEEGILSRDEIEEVLEKSKMRNLSLEETLFKLGYVSRDRLGDLLAKLYECEFIDLHACKISDEALSAIPAEVALRLHALPYGLEGETLAVALAGPFEGKPLQEITMELKQVSGKEIRATLCNPETLREMLPGLYEKEAEPGRAARPEQEELASIIKTIKSEDVGTSLRGQLEELHDVGQTALIGARSHPFGQAVATIIEEAKTKLVDSRKHADSGFEEEAIEMARQAISLLKEATAKADSVESDWERLLQQVRNLSARIGSLEKNGAAGSAPSEFRKLTEIRDALIECVNERDVDRLRSLLDQGMILTEKASLLSPYRSRGREQVIASLAQVREVISRARKAGAKDYAPDVLNEAYEFLDRAEAYARHAQWEEVRNCLASAESKAFEAEGIAARAVEEKEQLRVKLRGTVRAATAALEEAMAHPFAQEVIEDLMRVKDVIGEAKACFESNEYERGIALGETAVETISNKIIVSANEAERVWNELSQRADGISALIQSMDIPLALKTVPAKVKLLFEGKRDVIGSLCERNRERLAAAVSACEGLARETRESIAPAQEVLRRAESAIADAGRLLASAAASGIDEQVASAYEEARSLLEDASNLVAGGDAEAALNRAEIAQSKLQAEVIERQQAGRGRWTELVSCSAELLKRIDAACSPDALQYCPELVHSLRDRTSEMLSALAARDPERIEACIAPVEETTESISATVDRVKSERLREISEQLAEIEKAVQTAVDRCSGSYAPDMLEGAYLDVNRIKEQIAAGPEALNAASESSLARNLAVARTKVWQVEFLRERYERERQENFNQLRLKMDSAREAIEACAKLDFVGDGSPLVQKAHGLLEQADNLLVEGDIEGSFALVRQSQAVTDRIQAEAEERERQRKELADLLTSDGADHRKVLADPAAEKIAEEEYRRLSELAEQTQSIIDAKDINLLEAHAEKLNQSSKALAARIEVSREESRTRIEQKIQLVRQEIQLARLLSADDFCPDVIAAASAYLRIAESCVASNDFARADSAALDALAKSRDASTLARAGLERAGALALDYMKIALAHIARDRPDAANEALERGLMLAELALASRKNAQRSDA